MLEKKVKRVLWRFWRYRAVRYVLFTAVTVLVFGEITLRIIGAALYPPIEKAVQALQDSDSFKILCLGDSHTYGMDAPKHLSYPRQLANLLNNQETREVSYEVANLGVPGFNSSEALLHLKEVMLKKEIRPDLVIFGAGHNNSHNLRHSRIWKDESMKTASPEKQLRHLLEHAKVYRLGRITMFNLKRMVQDPDEEFIFNPKLADKEILTSWLTRDLEETMELVREAGGRVLFMNYYFSWDYINRSLEYMEKTHGIPYVDVRGFRMGIGRGLTGPTGHPNEKGYAAIARFIHEALIENGMIPHSPHYRPTIEASIHSDPTVPDPVADKAFVNDELAGLDQRPTLRKVETKWSGNVGTASTE